MSSVQHWFQKFEALPSFSVIVTSLTSSFNISYQVLSVQLGLANRYSLHAKTSLPPVFVQPASCDGFHILKWLKKIKSMYSDV